MKLGRRISSINTKGEGVELGFEDGTSAKADLVIGADGIRSVSLPFTLRPSPYNKMKAKMVGDLTGCTHPLRPKFPSKMVRLDSLPLCFPSFTHNRHPKLTSRFNTLVGSHNNIFLLSPRKEPLHHRRWYLPRSLTPSTHLPQERNLGSRSRHQPFTRHLYGLEPRRQSTKRGNA